MEQKVRQSIPVLKQKFFSLIQENHYSEQYQNYLRFRFAALESDMVQNGCHDYSTEIGEQFISAFNKNRVVKKSTHQALDTFISKVNDVLSGGCLWLLTVSARRLTATHPTAGGMATGSPQ